jgi:hypothetical protein
MEKLSVYASEMATSHLDDSILIDKIVVSVATQNVMFAGTDAKVHLNIGTHGKFELNKPGEEGFEAGTLKTFEFNTGFTLGDLRKAPVELGHNNTGKNPGWCAGGVRIEIKPADSDIIYIYKLWEKIGWLATDSSPYFSTVVRLQ